MILLYYTNEKKSIAEKTTRMDHIESILLFR